MEEQKVGQQEGQQNQIEKQIQATRLYQISCAYFYVEQLNDASINIKKLLQDDKNNSTYQELQTLILDRMSPQYQQQ